MSTPEQEAVLNALANVLLDTLKRAKFTGSPIMIKIIVDPDLELGGGLEFPGGAVDVTDPHPIVFR